MMRRDKRRAVFPFLQSTTKANKKHQNKRWLRNRKRSIMKWLKKNKINKKAKYNKVTKNRQPKRKKKTTSIWKFWNGKTYQLNSIRDYSLKLLIWEMPAFLPIISHKIFKRESTEHLKSYLDIHMPITLMFGH